MRSELACPTGGPGRVIVPKPYPPKFRDDVVRVARKRPGGTTRADVDGIRDHPTTLLKWLRQADVDDGVSAGVTAPSA